MSYYKHSVYSVLHDEDLRIAMDAVRAKLKNPDPPERDSMFSFGNRDTVSSLITQLGMMQAEIDHRIATSTTPTRGPQP